MRRYITRLVVFNALICAVFAAVFAMPLAQVGVGLAAGLVFGVATGLLVEAVFQRWRGRWVYRRRMLFLALLEALLVLYLVLPAYFAYFSLRPPRQPVPEVLAEWVDAAETVTLRTSDGIDLAGWYIPPQNGAVIIALHGGGGSRMGVVPHARMLVESGYGVLMMDLRAHGASGGDIFVENGNAGIDMGALTDYLRARPEVRRIGALGLSVGANMMFHAGVDNDAIEVFVGDGTSVGAVADLLDPLTPAPVSALLLIPDYWVSYQFTALFTGLTPAPPLREQVKRIAPRPMLFIAGASANWEPELAAKYAASAGDSAEMWVIPESEHIQGIFVRPDEYAARVTAFFDTALLSDP